MATRQNTHKLPIWLLIRIARFKRKARALPPLYYPENIRAAALRYGITITLLAMLAGCSTDRGWRFEIGVSPVTRLDNRAGLEEARKEDSKSDRRF